MLRELLDKVDECRGELVASLKDHEILQSVAQAIEEMVDRLEPKTAPSEPEQTPETPATPEAEVVDATEPNPEQ